MGACMGEGGRWRGHVAPIAAQRRHDEDRERKASVREKREREATERETTGRRERDHGHERERGRRFGTWRAWAISAGLRAAV